MENTKLKRGFIFGLVIVLPFIFLHCTSENEQNTELIHSQDAGSGIFDQDLADELGADNFGMRAYVMAFLKAGPNRDHDEQTAMEIQRGHMENINRLADEGKLILAGPFLDRGELRGIFLFDVATIEEARELTETDPAIQAGRLEMDLHPWYGSAALLKVNEIHRKIAKDAP